MANKARLIEVRDKILANKDRFLYHKWAATLRNPWTDVDQEEIASRLETDCLTCGCIAGWTYTCIPKNKLNLKEDIADNAVRWLELKDFDEYHFLFVAGEYFGLPKVPVHEATVWDAIQRLNLLIDRETEKETADAE